MPRNLNPLSHADAIQSMEQDSGPRVLGHEVKVEGDLFIARLGKRCFGPVQFRVTRAKLLWMGAGDEPMPPARNLAPVLAERLGTDEAEAVLLGYDVILNESEDGLLYGLILDFNRTASPEVAERRFA